MVYLNDKSGTKGWENAESDLGGLGGSWDSGFLTNSEATLMLLVWSHFESQGSRLESEVT